MEAHLQYVFDIAWSNEDSDGMEAGHLETLYGVPRYVQYAVFSLQDTDYQDGSVSISASSHLHPPFQPLLSLTVCWFHTDGCCTVQPRWICAPGSLLPWPLWRRQSGNLGRPPHSLAGVVLCLRSYARDTGQALVCSYEIQLSQWLSNLSVFTIRWYAAAFEKGTHVGHRIQTCQGTQRWGHRWRDLSLVREQWQAACS